MSLRLRCLTALLVCAAALPLIAQTPTSKLISPTPPMGWNSWDAYAQNVTEAEVKQNSDFIFNKLKQFGWRYIVVDEGWYLPDPGPNGSHETTFVLDASGRFTPELGRFPSAANGAGFKPLADYIHAQRLKFGIHIIRGIPKTAVEKNLLIAGSAFHANDAADQSDTCPWNTYNYGVKDNAAGQAYYDSLAKLYASWGVDFLKVDCIAAHPYKPDEIRMISAALRKTGRPVVLSLSPGPTDVSHADEVRKYAEMWRISDDFWDHWGVWQKHEFSQGLRRQFVNAAAWAPHTGDGHWADADMLPIGHIGPRPGEGDIRDTKFTQDEQRTLLTLWSIFRSPLIIGANLPASDPFTLTLLDNPEVIAVDQHSTGNGPVISTDTTIIWTGHPEQGSGEYVAVFNVSDAPQVVRCSWKELGIDGTALTVRDLWQRKNLGQPKSLEIQLAPHASVLYRVRASQ